jgi:hypothetical protein
MLSSFKTHEQKVQIKKTCCKCKDIEDTIHAI